MTITPLSALDLIPDNSDLEAIQIRLLKLDEPKPFGSGTIQSAYAEDVSGNKASVRFADFQEPLTQDWVGPWMTISATRNGKGELTGLSVDSYNGKKRVKVKGIDQHGRARTEIKWHDGIPEAPAAPAAQPARQAPPPQQRPASPPYRPDVHYDNHHAPQHQPPPRPAGPPSRQGPPPQAQAQVRQAPQPPAQPTRPVGPHGATVGMAVKEAFTALIKGVSPEGIALELRNPTFWVDVHAAASEMLHLCKALESGDIAKSCTDDNPPDFQAEEAAAQDEPWQP